MAVSRRKAREAALRTLYSIDIGGMTVDDALNATLDEGTIPPFQADYATVLVRGVAEHIYDLDDLIMAFVKDYDDRRLASIDRNLIRL